MSKLSTIGIVLGISLSTLSISCGGSGSSGGGGFSGVVEFSLAGLPDLGDTGHYQAWIGFNVLDGGTVVGREIRSLGKFTVFGNGATAAILRPFGPGTLGTLEGFQFQATGLPPLDQSAIVFITFEQADDRDNVQSRNMILAGTPILSPTPKMTGERCSTAQLTVAGPAEPGAGVADFSTAAGCFRLFSPTDDDPDNENFGIWFTRRRSIRAASALELPPLPKGWTYESWLAGGGAFVSLGRFRDPEFVDEDHASFPGRGLVNTGPRVPGQDFIDDAEFRGQDPVDLTSTPARVRITVEPFPDNNETPFQLELLSLEIPEEAVDANGLSSLTPPMTLNAFDFPGADVTLGFDSITLSNITLSDLATDARNLEGEIDPEARAGLYGLWVTLPEDRVLLIDRFVINGIGPAAFVIAEEGGTVGNLTAALFTPTIAEDLRTATEVFITVEPDCCGSIKDGFFRPSPSRLLSGTVQPTNPPTADLDTTHIALAKSEISSISSFREASGAFFLTTPSDNLTNPDANDAFGCWFPRLNLPELAEGWIYEGTIEALDGSFFLSTGRFRNAFAPDSNRYTTGTRGPDNRGFFFPGEDFTNERAASEIFTLLDTGLRGTAVFLTVEPDPDNSPDPFFLQPLTGNVIFDPSSADPFGPDPNALVNTSNLLPAGTVTIRIPPAPTPTE